MQYRVFKAIDTKVTVSIRDRDRAITIQSYNTYPLSFRPITSHQGDMWTDKSFCHDRLTGHKKREPSEVASNRHVGGSWPVLKNIIS